MPRVIEVIVAKDGAVSIQTKGYSGAACLEASRSFEQVLGVTTGDLKTSEFFETTTIDQQVQQSE